MSDPVIPQPEQPKDVDDVVDSANAGLDAAEAARADVDGGATPDVADEVTAGEVGEVDASVTDPDIAAFEAAERDHPGTFSTPELNHAAAVDDAEAETAVLPAGESDMAEAAYAATSDADTHILPSEPVIAPAVVAPTVIAAVPVEAPIVPQPIFVQAPEPPRELGNRGTAGAIGLVATVAFAALYLGATLGFGALDGQVTLENIGTAALAPLSTWGFWVPVVAFFFGFWLLGAFINRGRWGRWVFFGIIVGVFAYFGHILGQLFEAPFWNLTSREGSELVTEQMLAPLAIAGFVFARELTIWFGAWVARSGARKTEINAEAQLEYERTLEAGPTLAR